MTLRVIRTAGLVRQPWKNGGGTTTEIAVHPAGANLDRFDWRVSLAEVAADGPFSTFPGIDRTLVLVRGAGLVLNVDGQSHRLDPSAPMVCFSGEAATTGRLVDGPVRDVNVMTRRGHFRHMVRVAEAGRVVVDRGVLIAHADPVIVTGGGTTRRLEPLDAAAIEGTAMLQIDQPALLITLSPA